MHDTATIAAILETLGASSRASGMLPAGRRFLPRANPPSNQGAVIALRTLPDCGHTQHPCSNVDSTTYDSAAPHAADARLLPEAAFETHIARRPACGADTRLADPRFRREDCRW